MSTPQEEINKLVEQITDFMDEVGVCPPKYPKGCGSKEACRKCAKSQAIKLLSLNNNLAIVTDNQELPLLHLANLDYPNLALERAKYYRQAQEDMVNADFKKVILIAPYLEVKKDGNSNRTSDCYHM